MPEVAEAIRYLAEAVVTAGVLVSLAIFFK